MKWLIEIIEPQLDWAQYGGQKGYSTSHLIIELLTFIHYNLDLRKKQAIVLTCVDYYKAFNNQDHNNFLIILHEMAVPGWLLRIVSGFLKDRVMIMTYNGGISERKQMPGGGPAGTTLGLLMFMTLINKTANPGLKQDWGSLLTAPLRGRKQVIMTHGKQVDDASLLEAVDMEKALTA